MLEIYLIRSEEQGVWLKLPSSPTEIGKVYAALDGIDSAHFTRIGDAASSVHSLSEHLRGKAVTDQGIKELQFLARRIDGLTEQEQMKLGAMLDIEKPYTIMEIVNLSCNMDKFAVYPDVHNEAELGQYLLQQRKISVSDEVLPYVDYEGIGSGYATDHAGCFSECGYVFRTGEALESVYDFKHLPDPAYEKNSLFLLQFYTDRGSYSVSLPASQEKLELLKKHLDVADLGGCTDFYIKSSVDGLKERLPCGCSVQELNGFAGMLQQRILDGTEETCIHLLAALEAEAPDNMDFAAEIADNLDCYDFMQDTEAVQSPTDYAHYIIENEGLFIADEAMDFIDYEAMGKELLHDHGVIQTSFGPVCRTDRPIRQLPEELTTLRLFSPLTANAFSRNEWGDISDYPEEVSPYELCAHVDEIQQMIEQGNLDSEGDRGLAVYLDNVLLKRKVQSMNPAVEIWQGELWGVLEVQTHGELSVGEMKELISQWEGQCSDGWGEGFEQRPIQTGDGELYVSFWHSGSDFTIKLEQELKNGQAQGFGMQMGGM